jgi:DNA/RNA endonuclease YhcR with UshA esterase domain
MSDERDVRNATPVSPRSSPVLQPIVDNVNSSEEVVIINFKDTQDSQFYAVVLRSSRDALEKSFNGDIGKAITGKTIQVTGTIVLYHDRPEIVISTPSQLVVTN